MNKNPFSTLEAIKEHVDGAWLELAGSLGIAPRAIRDVRWPMASVGYHLKAAEEGCSRLYQQLAILLPAARALDEGDVTDSIAEQLGGEEP